MIPVQAKVRNKKENLRELEIELVYLNVLQVTRRTGEREPDWLGGKRDLNAFPVHK